MLRAAMAAPMRARAALLLAALLAPAAAADLTYSGTHETEDAHVPQMHCAFVQTEPHGRADQLRCDLEAPLRRAMVLRVRIAGPGHVYAFLRDEVKQEQIAQLDCFSAAQQTCLAALGGRNGLTMPRVALHAFMDGPAPAAATVTVERVEHALP